MTDPVPPVGEPSLASAVTDNGDVGAYLDELIVDFGVVVTHAQERYEEVADVLRMELVGPHLRLSGDIGLGRFRRISDVLNHHEGLLRLRDVAVLRRNGTATRVSTPEMWVSPGEVTLFGQTVAPEGSEAPPELRIIKEPHALVVVTPGHTLTGSVYVPVGADLSIFIESPEPAFIPMTGVRARSLADRRIVTSYAFALLNRRHIVAATEMPTSMQGGGWRI